MSPLLLLLLAAVLARPPAGQAASGPPQVGVPGCRDDVAVRATREGVEFTSRGRTVRAWLYAPAGPPNGRGLVLLHGGTGFEMNAILFDAHAIQLASRGYHVLLPAYFDAAAPDPQRRTVTARAWRQAALDAAAELGRRSALPHDVIALWGYSRGAAVAADAATAAGGGVRAAILAAGGGRLGDEAVGRDISVLMLHARRDEAVPVRATPALADDLRTAGAAVDVRELDFDRHQYDLPTWCEAFRLTRTFLEDRGAGEGANGPP